MPVYRCPPPVVLPPGAQTHRFTVTDPCSLSLGASQQAASLAPLFRQVFGHVFRSFLQACWILKASQNESKMHQKNVSDVRLRFRTVFSSVVGGFLVAFPSARTDFIPIYNVFVRCATFRRVKKTIQSDFQKCSILVQKLKPKCFQNRIKNCIVFWDRF